MRFLIRTILFLLLFVAVAVGSLLLLPGERIAKIASEQISALTGREVVMSGDTKLSFYPVLGVSTGAVTVANAEWSDGTPMFQAASLKIGVEPQVLWGGDIRITGLEAESPVINLERARDGRVNWELGVAGVAASGQSTEEAPARSSRLALTLDRALIRNATFRYTDHGTGERTEMSGMRFDLRWPKQDGRARFDATLRPAGEPVKVEGHINRVADFIDGEITGVVVNVSATGGTLAFEGRAGTDPQAKGKLTAKLENTGAFMAALGLPAAEIPKGLGRTLDAEARLVLTAEQQLSLRQMVLKLDGNQLTGGIDVALAGTVPTITARLDAGALDLSGLSGGSSGESAGAAQPSAAEGWSKAPIDASALALANGEVVLNAESVNLGDLKLGPTRTKATLDASRLVFDLRRVKAYEGLISGQFVMNNRSGLSVGGDLTVEKIDMESFLTDAAGLTRFSGKADARLKFLGVGQTEHAIMNSLSGSGSFSTGRGVISGIDLDKLMRSGDVTGGTTIFDKMSASFTMDKGTAVSDDLEMVLPLAKAGGKGGVGIGARTINYLFTPVLLEGENSRGLAIPVRIKGPWADPQILPDVGKAIEMNLGEERKQLEDEAEKALREAAEKELGRQIGEDEKIEDVIRDTLEDEARKGLLKLFE
ncbi:MAG: AsmA family protein [Roseovarius sp.]